MKKYLKLSLMVFFFAFSLILVGCVDQPINDDQNNDNVIPDDPDNPDNPDNPVQNVDYSIIVKAKNGKLLEGVYVEFLDGNERVSEHTTDSKGLVYDVLPAKEYTVNIDVSTISGYTLGEEESTFVVPSTGAEKTVICDMELISDPIPSRYQYAVGDQFYDFETVDTYGNPIKISEILQTKKLVVLNFWFASCSPCRTEFPLLENAYSRFKDDVEVIGINWTDSQASINAYKANGAGVELTFPMVHVADTSSSLCTPFQTLVTGYPTTMFIDRFGTLDQSDTGAIVSQAKWDDYFKDYISDDYIPEYKGIEQEEIVREEPPTTEINSDELVEAGLAAEAGFTTEFKKETNVSDAPYSWPWVATEVDGVSAIQPSNAGHDDSFSIVYFDVPLQANKVIAFDFKISSEAGADALYALVDGQIHATISGVNDQFQTYYLFVGNREETVEVCFIYLKDNGAAFGDDTAYINNIRLIDATELDSNTKIQVEREASYDYFENAITGQKGYESYVEVVYNPTDGYYHVGTETGPLLLAKLTSANTHFSNTSMNEYAETGALDVIDISYAEQIINYASYGSNGYITMPDGTMLTGYVPVTLELRTMLEAITVALGSYTSTNIHYNDQWLELCVYFDVYGQNATHVPDPTRGLSPFNCDTLTTETEVSLSFVRSLLPQGYLVKFIPTESGVYKFTSKDIEVSASDVGYEETVAWLFNPDNKVIRAASDQYLLREYQRNLGSNINFEIYEYLEANTEYYIRACFGYSQVIGSMKVTVEYVDTATNLLNSAAEPTFTADESLEQIVIRVIRHGLGTDGFYHPYNGSELDNNKFIYADFKFTTNVFTSHTLEKAVDMKDADGKDVYDFSDVLLATAEIKNYTSIVKDIIASATTNNPDYNNQESELYGLIRVDEQLQEILQLLMDKYTFSGVENSWMRFCYFYQTVDANNLFASNIPNVIGDGTVLE